MEGKGTCVCVFVSRGKEGDAVVVMVTVSNASSLAVYTCVLEFLLQNPLTSLPPSGVKFL